MMSAWSRRYFILYTATLEYYSLQEGNAPVPIDIRLCTVKPAGADCERRFCFDLVSPTKTFTLQAENEVDLEQWMDCLKEAIQRAIKDSCRLSSTENVSIDSILNDDHHRIERPMTVEEITQIRGKAGNDRCAECGDSDPLWASTNHGILLCIACSGVHRGLGAQVSKVRSLELDYWEPAQIEIMLSLGNAKVNAVLENNYVQEDGDSFYYRKPCPDSDQLVREQWVTAKYSLCKFVKPADDDDDQIRLLWEGLARDDCAKVYRALRNGAKIDAPNEQGMPPLLYAVRNDQYACALLLIYSNADVNCYDAQTKQTPLHALSLKCDHNAHCMLMTVLKRHAHIGARDLEGKTPLDCAVEAGNGQAATVLRIAALAGEFDEVRVSGEGAGGGSGRSRAKRHQRFIKKITKRII
jgi:Arf-GAP/coiled-coil/ANK repeat/PH domain-containing protein